MNEDHLDASDNEYEEVLRQLGEVIGERGAHLPDDVRARLDERVEREIARQRSPSAAALAVIAAIAFTIGAVTNPLRAGWVWLLLLALAAAVYALVVLRLLGRGE